MLSQISQMATKRLLIYTVVVVLVIWLFAMTIPNVYHDKSVSDGDASTAGRIESHTAGGSWGQEDEMEDATKNALVDEEPKLETTAAASQVALTVVSTVTNTFTSTKTVTKQSNPTKTGTNTEVIIPEIHHHIQVNNATNAKYLVMVATRDDGWGHVDGAARDINGFLEMVKEKSGLPLNKISFAVSTGSKTSYEKYISILSEQPFAKVQVVLYEPTEHVGSSGNKHDPSYQPIRRQQIALARNLLMLRALGDEQDIIWYDSDVVWSTQGIAARMLQHSRNGTDSVTKDKTLIGGDALPIGLITTRSTAGDNKDYDLNAWAIRVEALRPYISEEIETRPTPFVRSQDNIVHMKELTERTTDDELFPLTAVGGVVLYIRASLVRKGLNFPPYYVVGAIWERQGGDGIETEGICYIARTMGYECYGLGGDWHVDHIQ